MFSQHYNFPSKKKKKKLSQASFLVKRASYEDIAEKAYGRPGRMVAMIANTCVNLGCLVAYVNVLCDVLSSVANSVIPPGAEPSRWVIMAGVSLLAMLPLSIVLSHRDNSNLLGLMSTVSVAILVVFATVVVAFAFNPIADAKPVHVWKRSGVFVAFPLLSYAFMCHTTLFTQVLQEIIIYEFLNTLLFLREENEKEALFVAFSKL